MSVEETLEMDPLGPRRFAVVPNRFCQAMKYRKSKFQECRSRITKFRQSLFLRISAIATLCLLLPACGKADPEQEQKNLDNEIVRIEISGTRLNIPMRYMYGEAVEKWGGWPKAKKERKIVRSIRLSMLLPDLRGYFPQDDVRWKVLGQGDKMRVLILEQDPSKNWFAWSRETTRNLALQGNLHKELPTIYGLSRFQEGDGEEYFADDGRELILHCNSGASGPSPSCRAKSSYRYGIALQYTYSRSYLPEWERIDNDLKSLLEKLSSDTRD